MVKREPIWKAILLDLSAAFFIIGGVVSLISTILMIPISTIYPFRINPSISFILIIVLIVGLICAVEAFECYRFVSQNQAHKAGLRGIVIGAILLSIGLVGGQGLKIQFIIGSATLILIAGVICYIYRE
ncbi:hypothetical protein KEJ47_10350 [Candidatus Bathyarchaeota archaeon]|nr:hypothetical protein [Candidatus Bathyarchaeota archaeon]